MPYYAAITLQGHTAKDRTTLVFNIGEPADHAAAQSAINQIRGALVDITKAFVAKIVLSEVLESDGQRPADTSADCFEEAAVSTYLNDALDAEKLHTIRVPAPIEALFLSDASTVNTANALLIQYVQQVSQHSFVSDGEKINTAIDNGIKQGYKRSRSRKFD